MPPAAKSVHQNPQPRNGYSGFKFQPGDIVFHKGSWDPVTIIESRNIYDTSSRYGSEPGYLVIMDSWYSGPQEQLERGFLSYDENLEYMENQLKERTDRAQRELAGVLTMMDDIERLRNHRP